MSAMQESHFRKHALTQVRVCLLPVWEGTVPTMSLSGLGKPVWLYSPGLQNLLAEFMICSESWADESIQENLWLKASNFWCSALCRKTKLPCLDLLSQSCLSVFSLTMSCLHARFTHEQGLTQWKQNAFILTAKARVYGNKVSTFYIYKKKQGCVSSPPSWYLQAIFCTILAAMEN